MLIGHSSQEEQQLLRCSLVKHNAQVIHRTESTAWSRSEVNGYAENILVSGGKRPGMETVVLYTGMGTAPHVS